MGRMEKMSFKQILAICIFLLIGIIVSFVTKKPWYYIPSSLVVGVMVALFVVKNKIS